MKKFITGKYFGLLLGILAFIGLWFLISAVTPYSQMVFPSPIGTVKEMGVLLGEKYTYKCIGMTLLKMILGFGISFVLAILLGLPAGNISFLRNFLKPFVTMMKAIPTAAVVFIFLVAAGFSYTPSLMVILVAFPILYEAVTNGVDAIDENILRASRIDSASLARRIIRIELPSLKGYILTGVLSSFSLSFKIAIMSEIICGSTRPGIGSAIKASISENPTDLTEIFAYCLISVLLMFIVSVIFDIMKKKLQRS